MVNSCQWEEVGLLLLLPGGLHNDQERSLPSVFYGQLRPLADLLLSVDLYSLDGWARDGTNGMLGVGRRVRVNTHPEIEFMYFNVIDRQRTLNNCSVLLRRVLSLSVSLLL